MQHRGSMKRSTRRVPVTAAIVTASLAIACPAQPAPQTGPQLQAPALARYHMRSHTSDLRLIERSLLAGQLDDATSRALRMIQKLDDPALEPWRDPARQVAEAALDLGWAPSIDEALRRVPRVAAACAGCHVAMQRPVRFPEAPRAPYDAAMTEARMARHRWATDRLWEGVIGPADDRWQVGLRMLAETPLPFTRLTDAPLIAARIQDIAKAQLAPGADRRPAARAAIYGELLTACAACHASLHAVPPAP